MKKMLGIILALVLVVSLLAVGCAKPETKIDMKDFLYTPAEVTVKVGEKVTWVNDDVEPHTITTSEWDSGSIGPGQSYSRTFDAPGIYDVTCLFHPTMLGKVTVIEK